MDTPPEQPPAVASEALPTPAVPEGYLVVSNIGKKDNIKRLLALAVTYGIEHVLIVGQPHFDLSTHAPAPQVVPDFELRVTIHRFTDLAACRVFLTERRVR